MNESFRSAFYEELDVIKKQVKVLYTEKKYEAWIYCIVISLFVLLMLFVMGAEASGPVYYEATGMPHGKMRFDAYEQSIMYELYDYDYSKANSGFFSSFSAKYVMNKNLATFDYTSLDFDAIYRTNAQNRTAVNLRTLPNKTNASDYDENVELARVGFTNAVSELHKIGTIAVWTKVGWKYLLVALVYAAAAAFVMLKYLEVKKRALADALAGSIDVQEALVIGSSLVSHRRSRTKYYLKVQCPNDSREEYQIIQQQYASIEAGDKVLLVKYRSGEGICDTFDVVRIYA